jgi:hypothetical protein
MSAQWQTASCNLLTMTTSVAAALFPDNCRAVTATQQEAFPEYDIPAGEDKAPEDSVDASRTEQDLGIVPIPLRETIVDMARTLIATGIAQPKRK